MLSNLHTTLTIILFPAPYNQFFKYLRVQVSTSGKMKVNINKVTNYLHYLQSSPLKPQKKLFMLREYLIPKLYHQLILGRITIGLNNLTSKFAKVSNPSFISSTSPQIPSFTLPLPMAVLASLNSYSEYLAFFCFVWKSSTNPTMQSLPPYLPLKKFNPSVQSAC